MDVLVKEFHILKNYFSKTLFLRRFYASHSAPEFITLSKDHFRGKRMLLTSFVKRFARCEALFVESDGSRFPTVLRCPTAQCISLSMTETTETTASKLLEQQYQNEAIFVYLSLLYSNSPKVQLFNCLQEVCTPYWISVGLKLMWMRCVHKGRGQLLGECLYMLHYF